MFKPAPNPAMQPAAKMHAYEVHPRKDKRGVNLISDALPFGRYKAWGFLDANACKDEP